jgi:hypothetical protein
MNRFVCEIFFASIVSLCISGCESKIKTKGQHQAAKADFPKEALQATEQRKTESDELNKMLEKVDLSDAPEFLKKMAEHIQSIHKQLQENMADCSKAKDAVKKYLEENKTEFEKLKISAKDLEKMSAKEKEKINKQAMAIMAPVVKETAKIRFEFAKKCPDEAKEVSDFLNKIN